MVQSVLLGVFGLGGPELTIILIAVVLIFGGKKIPELMKGLGKGIREFKDASKGPQQYPWSGQWRCSL